MTGVTTSEADITALLGCSASDWERVRSEAREEGRVSVTRARRQVSSLIMIMIMMIMIMIMMMTRGIVFRLSSRAASLG